LDVNHLPFYDIFIIAVIVNSKLHCFPSHYLGVLVIPDSIEGWPVDPGETQACSQEMQFSA